ncbi:MAG: RNA recognition motif-containing protein [Maribacter sp.]|jgi:RNA recognition motif-containing protein
MNIFVAKLDYSTSVDTVRELFEQYGEVSSAKIIMDRETGRSKGFGFIEMPEDEDGWNAIRELNGSDIDGREIVCKKSEPRENNNNRSGGGGGSGGGGFRKRFNRDDNRSGGGGGNRFDNRSGGGGGGNRFDRDKRDNNNRW